MKLTQAPFFSLLPVLLCLALVVNGRPLPSGHDNEHSPRRQDSMPRVLRVDHAPRSPSPPDEHYVSPERSPLRQSMQYGINQRRFYFDLPYQAYNEADHNHADQGPEPLVRLTPQPGTRHVHVGYDDGTRIIRIISNNPQRPNQDLWNHTFTQEEYDRHMQVQRDWHTLTGRPRRPRCQRSDQVASTSQANPENQGTSSSHEAGTSHDAGHGHQPRITEHQHGGFGSGSSFLPTAVDQSISQHEQNQRLIAQLRGMDLQPPRGSNYVAIGNIDGADDASASADSLREYAQMHIHEHGPYQINDADRARMENYREWARMHLNDNEHGEAAGTVSSGVAPASDSASRHEQRPRIHGQSSQVSQQDRTQTPGRYLWNMLARGYQEAPQEAGHEQGEEEQEEEESHEQQEYSPASSTSDGATRPNSPERSVGNVYFGPR